MLNFKFQLQDLNFSLKMHNIKQGIYGFQAIKELIYIFNPFEGTLQIIIKSYQCYLI